MSPLIPLIERLARLPRATHAIARMERDVRVPMDDGVQLLADVHHPRSDTPVPTVLLRSPHGRRFPWNLLGAIHARRGFRAVVESCRGTFGSGGVFRPQFDERADGLATVRWIERQPWFDGRLAMTGPSYLGFVQWAIAAEAGPSLRVLYPHVTMSNLAAHWYAGDSFALDDTIGWSSMVSQQESWWGVWGQLWGGTARRIARHRDDPHLLSLDERVVGRPVSFWRDFVTHAALGDPFWAPADFSRRIAGVQAPVAMDTFRYDPADPTPVVGGTLLSGKAGRRDQRRTEARSDVLVWTSDVLEHPVDVVGEVSAEIFVSSTSEHFDVFVRLCDVDERRRSTNVCDGIQRVAVSSWPEALGAVDPPRAGPRLRDPPAHRLLTATSCRGELPLASIAATGQERQARAGAGPGRSGRGTRPSPGRWGRTPGRAGREMCAHRRRT